MAQQGGWRAPSEARVLGRLARGCGRCPSDGRVGPDSGWSGRRARRSSPGVEREFARAAEEREGRACASSDSPVAASDGDARWHGAQGELARRGRPQPMASDPGRTATRLNVSTGGAPHRPWWRGFTSRGPISKLGSNALAPTFRRRAVPPEKHIALEPSRGRGLLPGPRSNGAAWKAPLNGVGRGVKTRGLRSRQAPVTILLPPLARRLAAPRKTGKKFWSRGCAAGRKTVKWKAVAKATQAV